MLTCHEGALALSQLALDICQPLQSVGQLVPLLLQHSIIHSLLLPLLLLHHPVSQMQPVTIMHMGRLCCCYSTALCSLRSAERTWPEKGKLFLSSKLPSGHRLYYAWCRRRRGRRGSPACVTVALDRKLALLPHMLKAE